MEKPCVEGPPAEAGGGAGYVAPGGERVPTWGPSQGLRVWGGEWKEDGGGCDCKRWSGVDRPRFGFCTEWGFWVSSEW